MNKEYQKVWQQLRQYEGEILGFIKQSVEDGEVARDLFQDVYYQALLHLPELNPERSLKNWLYTVARNRVLNYFRDSSRRTYQEVQEHHQITDAQFSEVDQEAVQFALKALPERQRKVFLLREIEELDYQTLAKEMNLSEAALTSLLNRARKNFKKHYQLFFLPAWLQNESSTLPLDDLLRFVRPENTDHPILTEVLKKSQSYFSRLKQHWDPIRAQFFRLEHLQNIFKHLPDLSQRIVLDAGSATGMVALNCALKAQKVIALDLNKKFVQHLQQTARTLGLKNLINLQADLRKTPVWHDSIDVIFTVLVLHHLPQPQKWFKTAFQILKPGGQLVVVEFERHHNKQLADTMHDLWLGFQPSLIKRWAKENNLELKTSEQWLSKPGVPVRWYLFVK